jgi:hypothetical protein
MYLVNFTRFHLRDEHADSVLSARRRWGHDHKCNDRFRGGLLVALDDGEWLDIAIWERPDRPEAALLDRAAPNEFVDRLDGMLVEILGLETGTLMHADPTRDRTTHRDPLRSTV